jgi:membrane associated rhomboid family serine protease
MARFSEEFLLEVLQACADCAPAPLYPAQFAKDKNLDRDQLDQGLDELRRRGLVKLTDWVKDLGQGRALTEAGADALKSRRPLPARPPQPPPVEAPADETGDDKRAETVHRAIFRPGPAYVTFILLGANIAYFIVGAVYAGYQGWDVGEYLSGDGQSVNRVLMNLGGLHPLLVFPPVNDPDVRPQYERIVLCNFLHIGLLHLGMNMYFLVGIGRQIEGMWGSLRFLVIYAVSAVTTGCTVLLIAHLEGDAAMVAGASGCLYGIFTAMVVFIALNHHYLPEGLIQNWSRNIGINVFLLVAINFLPGLSWQGHFGGAVGGLLAGLLLQVQRFHPVRAVRILALLGVPLIPAVFFLAVLWQEGRL